MHELMVFYYVSSAVCPVVVPTYLPTTTGYVMKNDDAARRYTFPDFDPSSLAKILATLWPFQNDDDDDGDGYGDAFSLA